MQLPENSRDIYVNAIDSSKWYPLDLGGIIPTRKIADLFYQGDYKNGSWLSGNYSAEKALTGIYKIFVKASTPSYIVERASRVFSTYYRPCEMKVIAKLENKVLLQITEMKNSDEVIEYRIAGWIQKALEISGANNVHIAFPKSITKGDMVTEMEIFWE